MSKTARSQLVIDFAQSYRLTGQLFLKLLQTAVQENPKATLAGMPILKVLKQQGSLSQAAIARELYHSGAAISRQIGILAGQGLVRTAPDEQNKRSTIVELTREGEQLLKDVERSAIEHLTNVLDGMPDEQLRRFIDNNDELQKIVTTNLRKEPRV